MCKIMEDMRNEAAQKAEQNRAKKQRKGAWNKNVNHAFFCARKEGHER